MSKAATTFWELNQLAMLFFTSLMNVSTALLWKEIIQKRTQNGKYSDITLQKKQDSDTKTQLKQLTSHEMLLTMFPNLIALANICMS